MPGSRLRRQAAGRVQPGVCGPHLTQRLHSRSDATGGMRLSQGSQGSRRSGSRMDTNPAFQGSSAEEGSNPRPVRRVPHPPRLRAPLANQMPKPATKPVHPSRLGLKSECTARRPVRTPSVLSRGLRIAASKQSPARKGHAASRSKWRRRETAREIPWADPRGAHCVGAIRPGASGNGPTEHGDAVPLESPA